jgi:hypothetical protein
MQSTLKETDPHDIFVIEPDVVLAAREAPPDPVQELLSDLARKTAQTAPEVSVVAPTPAVDTTFRATAVDPTNKAAVAGDRPAIGWWVKRSFIAFLFALCSAFAAAAWTHHGAAAKQMISSWLPPFVLAALPLTDKPAADAQPDVSAAQAVAVDQAPAQPASPSTDSAAPATTNVAPATTDAAPVTTTVAPAKANAAIANATPAIANATPAIANATPDVTPSTQAPSTQSMARDLATMGQQIEQLKASIEQLKASQAQMSRDMARTAEPGLRPRAATALPPRPVAALAPRPLAAPVHKPKPLPPAAIAATSPPPSYAAPAAPPPPSYAAPGGALPPPSVSQPTPLPQATTQPDGEPVVRPPMALH